MAALSAHHQEQIGSFLRFASYQREQHIKELDAVFEEMADSRLLADEYSEIDVRDILESLLSVTKSDMSKELEHSYHTHVLVLQQLFCQAEGMDLNFSVDTSQLENQSMLGDLKSFEEKDRADRELAAKMSVVKKSGLASLSKASDSSSHVDMIRRNNELTEELGRWKDKFRVLEAQALTIAKEKSEQGSHREALQSQFESMSLEQQQAAMKMTSLQAEASAGASAGLSAQQQIEGLKNDLAAVQEELTDARDQMAGKIDQSKQYQQLRKMIATKNSQLKGVRVRLAKYETDDTPVADD